MMIHQQKHPTVHIPPCPLMYPYRPSDEEEFTELSEPDDPTTVDLYSDEFRMYEFKIRLCVRGRSHDWIECPYAHPGEKARRRDPRKFQYSGNPCPEYKKDWCKKGERCEYAHGVFECWLHPARYRTQPCKDGTACRRRVCFFAHTPEQLRILSPSPTLRSTSTLKEVDSYDGSPMRLLAKRSSTSSSSCMMSADGLALWLSSRMRLGGGGGEESKRRVNVGVPTSRRRMNVAEEEEEEEEEMMTMPDFVWVSELIK